MNSKLRDILNHLGERHIMVEHRLIHVGMPEKNGKAKETAEAEKAIREAVAEEMLEMALPYCLTKAAERELREKIENWRMS